MAAMSGPLVVIFHQSPRAGEPPLTAMLAQARDRLVVWHTRLFRRAGAGDVLVVTGRDDQHADAGGFGQRLARVVAERRPRRGLIVLGSGAAALLRRSDAARLVSAAGRGTPVALTNNRYSSDVCAISHPRTLLALLELPPMPSDNGLPRWLETHAGYQVRELPGRARLAIDLDTPLDLALLGLVRRAPDALTSMARELPIPGHGPLRELAADPRRELLVMGRTSARTLRWLERHALCRVRALVEERGLKASAFGPNERPPRSVLGRLLAVRGPDALGDIVGELADGAIIDTRVLLADRLGLDEGSWPSPEDRFASDLGRAADVLDPWLAALTRSAANAPVPILLGAHTLVGPGIRLLLGA
jgi:hypothetical protein